VKISIDALYAKKRFETAGDSILHPERIAGNPGKTTRSPANGWVGGRLVRYNVPTPSFVHKTHHDGLAA
jgi:hypothetical protein